AIYYREFVSKEAFTSESKVFRAPPPSSTSAPIAAPVTIADSATQSGVTIPPLLIVTASPVEASNNVPPISQN
ncbi:MAG: hypothetical protein ACK5TC_02120, partial [bacterium]